MIFETIKNSKTKQETKNKGIKARAISNKFDYSNATVVNLNDLAKLELSL